MFAGDEILGFSQPGSKPQRAESEDADDRRTEEAIRAVLGGEIASSSGPRSVSRKPGKSSEPADGAAGLIPSALKEFRPTAKQVTLMAALLVTLVWPLLLPLLMVLVLALVLISYWTLGHDRSVELVMQANAILKRLRPDWAARVQVALERLSKHAAAVVTRLPERWTRGLYLPDFSPDEDMPEKMRHDPFERLGKPGRRP